MKYHKGIDFIHYPRLPRIRAREKLITLFDEKFGLKTRKSKDLQNPELIILRSPKDKKGKKHDIDYQDTPETNQMRENLRQINNTLQSHFIGLFATENQLETVDERLTKNKENQERFLEFSKTKLQRVFNDGRFDKG